VAILNSQRIDSAGNKLCPPASLNGPRRFEAVVRYRLFTPLDSNRSYDGNQDVVRGGCT
jgi:hypothetical protein